MPTNLLDEIKQTKPFASRSEEALLSILRTATVLEHGSNEVLRPFGITSTQYNVLRILRGAGAGGLCGKEIAERLISRVPDVSRLLDRMEEVGLLGKKRDANDRRHLTARITAKGRKVLEQATPGLEEFARGRVERLSARSVEGLVEALASIREGA
ncbi:MAG TPA: MarR family transcriptional regulator [Gemmatimonadaceae bacterium]|jgi:DNA-binding MarR family transcriptional regulator|nr:MarR family transcriptional regulator [Gemmatimonadaceae bacterium]